ncbi:MAG: helix-turn-helix transcriptional regulator [Desulfuromusa sp.]|nr:helix-turn-helix transcriptional regulator [Desulfuromusa sp.]
MTEPQIISFNGRHTQLPDLKSSELELLFKIFEKLSYMQSQEAIRKEISGDLLCLFDADFIASYVWDQDQKVFSSGVFVNMSPDNISQYESYFQFHDPITPLLQKQRQATLVSEIMPQKELLKTEFFNDFLYKDGLYHGMNVYAYDGNLNIGDLRIWRVKQKTNFEKREIALLNLILPYFRNALRNIRAMTTVQGESEFWNKLLKNTQTALFLFDNGDKLVFRNENAELIEKSLSEAGYFSFYSQVCLVANKNLHCSEWGNYYLSVSSLLSPNTGQPMTAVMANKSTPVKIDKDFLITRYYLTPRETDICLLVCKGLIDNEIAKVLGIAFYTVRTHLKNIFKKLDVINRSELISTLLEDMVDISF